MRQMLDCMDTRPTHTSRLRAHPWERGGGRLNITLRPVEGLAKAQSDVGKVVIVVCVGRGGLMFGSHHPVCVSTDELSKTQSENE